jgi:hypothetical protein
MAPNYKDLTASLYDADSEGVGSVAPGGGLRGPQYIQIKLGQNLPIWNGVPGKTPRAKKIGGLSSWYTDVGFDQEFDAAAEATGLTKALIAHLGDGTKQATYEYHWLFESEIVVGVPLLTNVWDFADATEADKIAQENNEEIVRPGLAIGWITPAEKTRKRYTVVALQIIIPTIWEAGYQKPLILRSKGMVTDHMVMALQAKKILDRIAAEMLGGKRMALFRMPGLWMGAGEQVFGPKQLVVPGIGIPQNFMDQVIERFKDTDRYQGSSSKWKTQLLEKFEQALVPLDVDADASYFTELLLPDDLMIALRGGAKAGEKIKDGLVHDAIAWAPQYLVQEAQGGQPRTTVPEESAVAEEPDL